MRIEPSFYTDEDVIEAWGITRDALECLVADELLTRSLKLLAGAQRQGITAEEKRRFEAAQRGGREPLQHGSQRKGDRMLMAAMALAFYAEPHEFHDDDADHHYKLIRQIAADVKAVTGLDLARTEESDANAIKEGLRLLRERGWRPRRNRASDLAAGVTDSHENEDTLRRITA